jgi:hypothetical protein
MVELDVQHIVVIVGNKLILWSSRVGCCAAGSGSGGGGGGGGSGCLLGNDLWLGTESVVQQHNGEMERLWSEVEVASSNQYQATYLASVVQSNTSLTVLASANLSNRLTSAMLRAYAPHASLASEKLLNTDSTAC